MELVYHSRTIKQLKKLPVSDKRKIVRKLEILVQDPGAGKLLKGEYKGLISLQAWPYRIIYQIKGKILIVFSVAHRQGTYKY